MRFNEPFLINPARRHARRFKKRSHKIKRFSRIKGLFASPRFRKARRRKARRNPLADLMIMNSPRRKSRRRKIISRSTRRGETQMAKRGRKRSRRIRKSSGKGHRLSLSPSYRISKRSKIARRMRGMRVNPAILGLKLPAVMPLMNDVLGITAGYVAVKLVPKYLFPAIGVTEPTGILGTVTKVAVVIGVSMVAGAVLRKPALQRALLIGGLVAVAVDLLGTTGVLEEKEAADGMGGYILPQENLSGYRATEMLSGDSEYEDTRR